MFRYICVTLLAIFLVSGCAGRRPGAVVGGLIGAVAGGSTKRSAGVGAVVGGAKGTYRSVEERNQVVGNCLRHRGYAALN